MREQRLVSISALAAVVVAFAIWRSRRRTRIPWWERIPMVKASIGAIELVTDAVKANRVALNLLNQSVVIGLDC